jgi:hypothetical protein
MFWRAFLRRAICVYLESGSGWEEEVTSGYDVYLRLCHVIYLTIFLMLIYYL